MLSYPRCFRSRLVASFIAATFIGSIVVSWSHNALAVDFAKAKVTLRNESGHKLIVVRTTNGSVEGNAVYDGRWVEQPPPVLAPGETAVVVIEGRATAPLRFVLQYRTEKSKNDELRIVGETTAQNARNSFFARGIGQIKVSREAYESTDYSIAAVIAIRDSATANAPPTKRVR